jgi:hypothetical protein
VTFDPDVFAVAMIPVAVNPTGVRVRRFNVRARNPDIVVALVAVIAGVPSPIAVLGRRRRNDFVGTRRGANRDVYLAKSVRGTDGEQECAGCGEKMLLHRAFSLNCCKWDADSRA